MTKIRLPRVVGAILLLAALAACSTPQNDRPSAVQWPDPADVRASVENGISEDAFLEGLAREAEVARREVLVKALKREYGETVRIGDDQFYELTFKNPFTDEANSAREVDFDGIDGPNMTAMATRDTDAAGQVAPGVVQGATASEQDVGRALIDGTFGVLGSAAHGIGAAAVHRTVNRDGCENGCAPAAVVLNEGGNAAAAAESGSLAESRTGVGIGLRIGTE